MPMISLRRCMATDAELYYRLMDETLRPHIVYAWGSFDETRAREDAVEFGTSRNGRVIEVDGEPSGVLSVDREADHIYVHVLCLLPTRQRMGAGTSVMRQVLTDARASGLPVRLRVVRSNPAKVFYERLGFLVFEETEKYWILEHAA